MGLVVGGLPQNSPGGGFVVYGTVHGFWSVSLGSNSTMPPLGGQPYAPGGQPGESFDSCPSASCNITVGLTLLRIYVSSPQLTPRSFRATLDIARALATIDIAGEGGASLSASLYVSATSQVALLSLRNTGKVALTSLNVTTAVNGNTQHVPLNATFSLAASSALVQKDANSEQAHSPLPISAAAAVRGVQGSNGAAVTSMAQHEGGELQNSWVTRSPVYTRTLGVTTLLALPPASAFDFVLSMAASLDAGVAEQGGPAQAVLARTSSLVPGDLPGLSSAHEAWWQVYYNASSVSLGGEPDTEAFWWSSIYTLGSGSRAGNPTMDLWSPWRTTDFSSWRSNPTME